IIGEIPQWEKFLRKFGFEKQEKPPVGEIISGVEKFLQGSGLRLLYVRGELEEETLYLDHTTTLSLSQLQKQVDQAPAVQQLLVIECLEGKRESLQKWVTQLSSSSREKPRCVLGFAPDQESDINFLNQFLQFSASQQLTDVDLLNQLQQQLKKQLICGLSGDRGLIEVTPRSLSWKARSWRKTAWEAFPKKLMLNFLNESSVDLQHIYIPLGLVKRRRKKRRVSNNISDPSEGSQLFTEQKNMIERQFEGEEFLERLLEGGKHNAVILGEPGAGKTTYLQKCGWWLHEYTQDPVIWISLKQVSDIETYVLEKWLPEVLKVSKVEESHRKQLEKLFRQERVWLLLDGVDEMSVSKGSPLSAIAQLPAWLKQARVILTCRRNLWETSFSNQLGNQFDCYWTLEFRSEQITEFIEYYFTDTPQKGNALKNALTEQGKERLRDLVKNPLRLRVLCEIWKNGKQTGTLPETQAQLFQSYVEYFYRLHQEQKEIDLTQQKRKQLNRKLEELAREGMERDRDHFCFTESEVTAQLEEDEFLIATQKLGWLTPIGKTDHPEENVYAFWHPTFQEYFAACAINDWDFFLPRQHINRPISGKQYRIFENKWQQVYLLWLGRKEKSLESQKDQSLQALVRFESGIECEIDFYQLRGSLLALMALEEFKDCSIKTTIINDISNYLTDNSQVLLRGKIVEALRAIRSEEAAILLIMAMKDEDKNVREKASEALEKIGSEEEFSPLIIALKDENIDVRNRAVIALEKIGGEKVVQPLTLALKYEDKDVRQRAVFALERIRSEKAVQSLTLALKDEDKYVRQRAVIALEKIGSEKVVQPLIIALKDEDKYVRRRAVFALGNIGGKEAVQPLIVALKDEDKDVRKKAAEALGKIGSEEAVQSLIFAVKDQVMELQKKAAVSNIQRLKIKEVVKCLIIALEKIRSEEAVQSLTLALNYEDKNVRKTAAETLGHIENKEAFHLLIVALKDENKEVRSSAAEALGHIGSGEAVQPLTLALKDEDKDVRKSAAEALGEIRSEEVVHPLILALKDEDKDVRERAVFTLGGIRSKEAVQPLTLALKDEDKDVRERAVFALGEIRSEEVVKPLTLALKDEDKDVRKKAVFALEEIRSEEAVSPLILALKDENYIVRYLAVEALGYIRSEEAVKPLVLALSDKSNLVRESAVEALGYIRSEEAVNSLILVLKDENADREVRESAARALGKIRNEEAVQPLILALEDEDKDMRIAVTEALGEIKTEEAVNPLILVLNDNNEEVRERAVFALEKIGSLEKMGGEEAVQLLEAEKAFEKIGDKETVKRLIQLFVSNKYSGQHGARTIAAETLRNIEDQEALTPLILCLKEEDNMLRQTAAEVLGKTRSEEAVRPLILALKRARAASALWHIAKTTSYPRFYDATFPQATPIHPEVSEVSPVGSTPTTQQLNNQLFELPNQISSPQGIKLICLNLTRLPSDTNAEKLSKGLSNQIFKQVIPPEQPLPKVQDEYDLQGELINLSRQTESTLVLLFYNGQPSDELINFCNLLQDEIHMGWVTEQPTRFRSFTPDAPNLAENIQSWLKELQLT
ncbi:MAG: hypothetical protein BRC37_16215, partial [Cyanobacteria bacterium QH_3_48_40]